MPARRLVHSILRQWVNTPVANRVPTPTKQRPLLRWSHIQSRASNSDATLSTTQQQDRAHRRHFDQENDREPPLVQRQPSTTDSLHQRLRYPRRSQGYEGNNATPKRHKTKINAPESSESSMEHAITPSLSKEKPNRKFTETKELERRLQQIAHHTPSVRSVSNLLRVLTVHRSVKPTASHYEALILSNCDAELGSISAVKAVLQEMEREHLAIGTSIYEAVLKVLAVHPDYIFRSSILDTMAKQWISLTPSMEHFVIAGYIREGQLELALQSIERMHQQKTPVGQWLYGLIIYSLCEVEDFDAVLRLLYHTEDGRIEIPTYTLHHVLDKASECLHLDLTKRIWHDMVEPTYINPSTGICYNVLLTAARSGDRALADSVSKVLSHRQSKPSDLEYDLLEETYVKAGDEAGAQKIRRRRDERYPIARRLVQREAPIRYLKSSATVNKP